LWEVERVSKYVDQINVRLPPELKREFEDVAEYESVKTTDLIRELIRAKVREVAASRAYQNWKRTLHAEKKEGDREEAVQRTEEGE